MQKHFAVVTGIGMLAVAGIVVSQQAGLFDTSLRGSLTNSFPTMASSVSGGFTPPAFPISLSSSSSMGGTMGGTGGYGTSNSSAGGCASCPSICGNGVTTNCCDISTNSCN